MTKATAVIPGGELDDSGAFTSFVGEPETANWSEELEELHEESSRDHFLDRYTREAILSAIAPSCSAGATVLDAGCSSGYLLEDLSRIWPSVELIGVDLVASGLRRAKLLVPSAQLLLANVCDLPIQSESVDGLVSSNLLEHVPDDRRALREFHRVLKPGARAAVVVPAGPGVYDYYDRFLSHERRYGRGELAARAERSGFTVLADTHIGAFLYPPFWLVKKRNRRLHPNPGLDDLQQLVESDISKTSDSRIGKWTTTIESRLLRANVKMPFGIRSFVVMEKPI